MNIRDLPEPIDAYFAADHRGDDVIARCFTTTAVVRDEARTYTGHEAITGWRAAAAAAYTYTTEPRAVEKQSGFHVVTSRVTGNFPGSPLDLRYRFRLEHGLIASLEITP